MVVTQRREWPEGFLENENGALLDNRTRCCFFIVAIELGRESLIGHMVRKDGRCL